MLLLPEFLFHLIQTFHKKIIGSVLTFAIASVMLGGVINNTNAVRADDVVCGDAVLDAPEACDDGNLKNGDGCSNLCTIELCGNALLDANEQCDDGNTRSGDGCNQYCQIEFCGDSVVQNRRHEECDDGNGLAGDGCTAVCLIETLNIAIAESNPSTPPKTSNVSSFNLQVQAALKFLASPEAIPYIQYLSAEQLVDLKTILKKIGAGQRLSAQERSDIDTLIALLRKAMEEERLRYLALLREFISTDISSDEVENSNLQNDILLSDEIPTVIKELQKRVDVMSRTELKNAVIKILSVLKGHGVDILEAHPLDLDAAFGNDKSWIDIFIVVKKLKEASELFATKDVAASYGIIQTEVRKLKSALPIWQREYNVDPLEIEPLLGDIEALADDQSREGIERMIVAIERLVDVLEQKKIVSRRTLAQSDEHGMHAAATLSRLIEDTGWLGQNDGEALDMEATLRELSKGAPLEAVSAFAHGTETEQGKAIIQFLEQEPRVQILRDMLRADGITTFDTRFTVLRETITRVGTENHADTTCDDTMTDALRCTNEYLSDLQTGARQRSFYSRLIGTLQDYFHIGS